VHLDTAKDFDANLRTLDYLTAMRTNASRLAAAAAAKQ
jgi:hypothetical protein